MTPTHVRRNKLMDSKSFFCMCERCTGPDYCRYHKCPNGGCDAFATCTQADEEATAVWNCAACGTLEESFKRSMAKREETIKEELSRVERMIMGRGGVGNVRPRVLMAVVKKASNTLSPLHFLTLEALESPPPRTHHLSERRSQHETKSVALPKPPPVTTPSNAQITCQQSPNECLM